MIPFRKVAVVTLVVALSAAVLYEVKLTAGQRERLRLLHARQDALKRELYQTNRQNSEAAAALSELQSQVDGLRASVAATGKSPTEVETRAWLAQLAKVRRLFAEHPEHAIPELQLLTLRQWLGAIKGLSFDTDEQMRKSFATIRDAAKDQFAWQLASTLQKFVNTRNGDLPQNLLELAPYFNPAVDIAILDRYKMNRSGNLANLVTDLRASDPVVLEKSAVDEDFDHRHGVNVGRMADGSGWGVVQGSFGGLGPAAWIDDYENRFKRACLDFRRDHPDATDAGFAQFAPYFNPPLDPGKVQKLIALERTAKH